MADLVTLRTRLSDAENALHQLMLGERIEQINAADKAVRRALTSPESLRSYIDWLRSEISRLENPRRSKVFTVQSSRGLQ